MSNLQNFQLPLLCIFALIALLEAQDNLEFISIDCGIENEYTDAKTTLNYVSDSGFIDTGISMNISTEYTTYDIDEQLQTLRSFPEGDRNCYEIGLQMGTKYLIRAVFLYGNYDSQEKVPTFDLYLGSTKWDTIDTTNSTIITTKEIIHMTTANYIYVCLVNTRSGTPFISTLEFRPLKNTTYNTDFGSLDTFTRLDLASMKNLTVRYPDDVFDRRWTPSHFSSFNEINAADTVDYYGDKNNYQPPSVVMRSAATAADPDEPLKMFIDTNDTLKFLVYMHFSEVENLEANQTRIFTISLDGQSWPGLIAPESSYTTTVESPTLLKGGNYQFSLFKVGDSTLPPLINAIEIFSVLDLSQSMSNQEDVDAIKNIKKKYKIKRNWQGDPCAPQAYIWDGLNCSSAKNDVPRITSLNLSFIGLAGEIPSSISSLTSLESLDLSNNSLTGPVPDFLSQLPSLKFLNLAGNKLSGSVPASLLEKSKQNMDLSVGGNPNLCASSSCESKKKKSSVVPIVALIVGVVILAAVATFSYILIKRRRRKQQGTKEEEKEEAKPKNEDEASESKGRKFTYSEVSSMTSNFSMVLGEGGFGKVYRGNIDGTEVAVKMLSLSSDQGSKQFQAEVRVLLRVHHRNLITLVGFCEEGTKMALVYEYMENGDIEKHISAGSDRNAFGWERRLQVAIDAAQGLEYLHNGCKPPIVHRDVKPANILLNSKFQAKLADFGISRSFSLEDDTHVSTVVAGSHGYLDPEHLVTKCLTKKSDVYSFGVFLFRIITGRPVTIVVEGESTHICKWVKSLLEKGDIKSVVDPSLGEDFHINSAWKAVEIAMACTSPTSSGRPTMHQVVTELNQCLAQETTRISEAIGFTEIMTDTTPLAR